jgi:hypothetical protein
MLVLVLLMLLAWPPPTQGAIETGTFSYKSLVRFHDIVTTKLDCKVS